jgi:maleylpyruvate isomerase
MTIDPSNTPHKGDRIAHFEDYRIGTADAWTALAPSKSLAAQGVSFADHAAIRGDTGRVPDPDLRRRLVEAVALRTEAIVGALGRLDDAALRASSELPGWSRLTIACHLRYGAGALARMTRAALAGRPTAYYPEGRERQRPGTLVPSEGESPRDVVVTLAGHSRDLDQAWSSLDGRAWSRAVVEPPDNRDLGPSDLARLVLLRLTEVEVHGSDLDLGLDDWSDLFVRAALPMRLDWLNSRRANHRDVDPSLEGSWLLVATDGPSYAVTVRGDRVESGPAGPTPGTDAVIESSSRDLLALLLGRVPKEPPRIVGDQHGVERFAAAFPGP